MKIRTRRTVGLVAAGLALTLFSSGASTADSVMEDARTNADRVAAVSPQASLSRNGDVIVDGVVFVPSQSSDGIQIGNGLNAFTVGLPDEGNIVGSTNQSGVTIYDSPGGSDDTVVPTIDGAQFLRTLPNRETPEEFTYSVDLPQNGRIALTNSGPRSGSSSQGPAAFVLNGNNQVVALVEAPWATDAAGRELDTYFTTDGASLTQHVEHRQQPVQYPVMADPHFRWYGLGVVITFNYEEMQLVAHGGITAATGLIGVSIPTGLGVIPASAISSSLLAMSASAAWGVWAHQCFWMWAPYPGVWDSPDHGYYSC